MGKQAAYGTKLSIGTRQVETATVVGTVTGSGDADVIVTADGMTGSPITTKVAVLENDTADTVAQKIRTALGLVANITAKFAISGSGPYVRLTRLIAAANDATLNISVENDTCTGITEDTTSDATVAGVASADIAQVKSIGGPGLSLDVEDVTTHDSEDAWEEVVATIVRTGEASFEIVYDPAAATHSAAAGILDYIENRKSGFFVLTFPDTTAWSFDGKVINFEPDAPVDGALTANVGVKITGKPTLA